MGRKKPRKNNNAVNSRFTFYCIREVNEQEALDLNLGYFDGFPLGLAPFRPIRIHWQVAMSTSAASSGNMVHRSVACQIQAYGPIDQTSDHSIWASAPILVPWGQRIQGNRRIRSNWFAANVAKETKILRVETLCILTDTAAVSTSWVISVTFEFGKPDYSASCPKGLGRFMKKEDKSDDDSSSFGTLAC